MSNPNRAEAQAALAAAEARFIANNPLSKDQHELAVGNLPGGNTRTLLHTSPFPLSMKQGKGAYVWDEDGHKYLDFVGELTAGLYGHSNPVVKRAVQSVIDEVGLNLGGTTVQEQRHAALLCKRFKLERVRMANTGTEANLHALAGARHYTGRRKVVVFAGGYHGAVLSFAGGKPAPNTVDRDDFVVVPRYNDAELAQEVIRSVGTDLAAVLVEPMQGAGGCIPALPGFLSAVQRAAHEAGALFILDEVMTSRLAPHGLGFQWGLRPDLVTLGKYLGGGFSFGAFGGRAEVMDTVYDPRLKGSLAHSGTFNNNTMTMRVGYAALSEVFTPEASVSLNARGDGFRERLQGVARGTRLSFSGLGSLIGIHFTEDGLEGGKELVDGSQVHGGDNERADLRDLFWFEMLEEGFWVVRRGMIAMILETPDEELDRFVGAVERFVERHSGLMRL